ncbi:homoaconitase mitochondrial precursor [Neoconidiobolus thromboides FSU 785]|nr:homoaconitase mitochondrial precursor [Neoconidiobolus thromboides FSU 785]
MNFIKATKANPTRLNNRGISSSKVTHGQNLVEKITQKYVLNNTGLVKAGDFVTIKPHRIMTHDNTAAVIKKFKSIGVKKVHEPSQLVYTIDHDVQNKSDINLAKYENIEQFAKSNSVDFYKAGDGIGHQIMIEQGYAIPNTFTVASDSHSNMYGGVGCLGTPLVRTDAAAVWATGKTWWQIPKVVKLEFINELNEGVTGKDVIITLCHLFNKDQVLNHIIEVSPNSKLNIDDRLTISNMSTEWGALGCIFPIDDVTIDYYNKRMLKLGDKHERINKESIDKLKNEPIHPDKDSVYSKHIRLDLSTIQPYVCGPNSISIADSANNLEAQKIKVDKAYLVSCTNSRLSDIKQAASILDGKKIKDGIQFYIAAASKEVQVDAENLGYWNTLVNAGAIPLPSGCGPCVGLGTGLLTDGEVGISASNRNFKGRMGSKNAFAYLASPAVVAASCLNGYISAPPRISSIEKPAKFEITEVPVVKSEKRDKKNEILEGFPNSISGEILYIGNKDNLNTDAIYAGKHTYNDNLTMSEMRNVAMENFDSNFLNILKEGDILIGGYNFGTGSSREQAATVFKACKIQAIVAGSYSETYKRNAINNGVLVLTIPKLIDYLRTLVDINVTNTVKLRYQLSLDFINSKVNVVEKDQIVKTFSFDPVGIQQQQLVVLNGLENWVRNELNI